MANKPNTREDLAKAIEDFQEIKEEYVRSDTHSTILAQKFLLFERDILSEFFNLNANGKRETKPKKKRAQKPHGEPGGSSGKDSVKTFGAKEA